MCHPPRTSGKAHSTVVHMAVLSAGSGRLGEGKRKLGSDWFLEVITELHKNKRSLLGRLENEIGYINAASKDDSRKIILQICRYFVYYYV